MLFENEFKIEKIDLDYSQFIKKILSGEIRELRNSDELGLYYPNLLVTTLKSDPTTMLKATKKGDTTLYSFKGNAFLKNLTKKITSMSDSNEKVDCAIDLTSIFHERRHFHDALCTPYGFYLFSNWFVCIFEMFSNLQEFSRTGNVLREPLVKSMLRDDAPNILKKTGDLYINFEHLFASTWGGIHIGYVPCVDSFYWENPPDLAEVRVIDETQVLFSIPALMARVVALSDTEPKKERYFHLSTLGFGEVTECAAVNVQQDIIGWSDKEIRSLFRDRIKKFLLQGTLKYGSIELLMTRWIKRNKYKEYNANALHRLLMGSLFPIKFPSFKNTQKDKSDLIFWKFLEEITKRLDIRDNIIKYKQKEYSESLDKWESTANEFYSFFKSRVKNPDTDAWAGMMKKITNDIVLKAIDAYRKCLDITDKDCKNKDENYINIMSFDSLNIYCTSLLHALPLPPMIISGDRSLWSHVDQYDSVNYVWNWLIWILHVSIIEQIMYKSELICPWKISPYAEIIETFASILPMKKCKSRNECGLSKIPVGKEINCGIRCPWEEVAASIGAISFSGKLERKNWLHYRK